MLHCLRQLRAPIRRSAPISPVCCLARRLCLTGPRSASLHALQCGNVRHRSEMVFDMSDRVIQGACGMCVCMTANVKITIRTTSLALQAVLTTFSETATSVNLPTSKVKFTCLFARSGHAHASRLSISKLFDRLAVPSSHPLMYHYLVLAEHSTHQPPIWLAAGPPALKAVAWNASSHRLSADRISSTSQCRCRSFTSSLVRDIWHT